jgi:uncharacterized membrane protein YccC
VLAPAGIFDTAILRVQEIGIAVAAVSLVHVAIWPRTIAKRLQDRVTAIVNDTESWSRRSLRWRPPGVANTHVLPLPPHRRLLATDWYICKSPLLL